MLPLLEECTLCNGSVHLPDGVHFQAAHGSSFLKKLIIKGNHICPLLAVSKGAKLSMTSCQFTNTLGAGITVFEGSCALCTECTALNCGGSGFESCGIGAFLNIMDGCRARNGRADGFYVGGGGRLLASAKTVAEGNRKNGFAAVEKGSLLTAGSLCISQSNSGGGYVTWNHGSLHAGNDCRAVSNGASGFDSSDGSLLKAGDSCDASNNASNGYTANDNSTLLTGEGCEAFCNGSCGFGSMKGSQLTSGLGCIARSNKEHGFYASASKLSSGRASRAQNNTECGFFSVRGGSMSVEGDSTSLGNKVGFMSMSHSTLLAGVGCKAVENLHGFKAADGGRVEASGCIATGNTSNDWHTVPGSTLIGRP